MLMRTIIGALEKRSRRKRNRKQRKQHLQQSSEDSRTKMPLAYALARSWAWPALKFRCETHPQEVSEIAKDSRGETILHWTCIGKPPCETVNAILLVCPEMAQVRNKAGNLPLHVAISYRSSVEVVRALLEAFPDGAGLPNGVGAYPLHLVCDYGSCVDTLSAILETTAGAATVDQFTGGSQPLTALDVLSTRMNYPGFRRAIQSMKEARKRQSATREALLQRSDQHQNQRNVTRAGQREQHANTVDAQNQQTDALASNENSAVAAFDRNERMISSFQQNDYWQKAALLVLVSYTRQPLSPEGLQDENANLVHACAGVRHCPSYLLEFAILLHMDDLSQKRDENGRLPLHVAAKRHAANLVKGPSRQGKRADALDMVLDACPAAAQFQDEDGNLPLAAALYDIQRLSRQEDCSRPTRTWSKGLQRLLDINLTALETLDLDESLLPFLWSRRLTSVDHLFQSIQRHPDLFDKRGRCGVPERHL